MGWCSRAIRSMDPVEPPASFSVVVVVEPPSLRYGATTTSRQELFARVLASALVLGVELTLDLPCASHVIRCALEESKRVESLGEPIPVAHRGAFQVP